MFGRQQGLWSLREAGTAGDLSQADSGDLGRARCVWVSSGIKWGWQHRTAGAVGRCAVPSGAWHVSSVHRAALPPPPAVQAWRGRGRKEQASPSPAQKARHQAHVMGGTLSHSRGAGSLACSADGGAPCAMQVALSPSGRAISSVRGAHHTGLANHPSLLLVPSKGPVSNQTDIVSVPKCIRGFCQPSSSTHSP